MLAFNIDRAPSADKPSKPPTDKAVKAALAAYVTAFWSLIRNPTIGSDTAKFLVKRPVSSSLEAELRNTNHNEKPPIFPTRAMQYYRRIDAQEPTEDGLVHLAEEQPDHITNGFDPAIDLPTDAPEIARMVARGLRLTMTMRWPSSAKTNPYKNSFYIAPRMTNGRKTRRNLDIYIRKEDPTIVRVEVRYYTARTVAKRGIRHSTDLLDPDYVEIMDLDLRVSAVSARKTDKLINKAARNYVEFMTADHLASPVTVAAAHELLWDEVSDAINGCQPLDDLDDAIPVQDLIACHPILHDAALHLRLSDILPALARASSKGSHMPNSDTMENVAPMPMKGA